MPFIRATFLPRMAGWLLFTALLFLALPYITPALQPLAHKALPVALGGVLGYWLDRALFPYDRPHRYLDAEGADDEDPNWVGAPLPGQDQGATLQITPATFGHAMLRRALVVAACVLGMALGGSPA